MTPEQYCYEKSAPLGSGLYFSMRKLLPAQRDAIVAIYAFYQEVEDVTLEFEDISVAQAKLNWWRDEVIKIQEGQPEHPVALALQNSAKHFSLPTFRLVELIDGLELNLTSPVFQTFEDVVIHIMRTAGARERLIAEGLQSDVAVEAVYQCALMIELVNYIQHLRRYVRKGLFYFAQDELQRFQVTEVELQEFHTTKNIQDLLQFQAEKLERSYQLVKEQLKGYSELLSIMIRCNMAREILKAIRESGFNVLENFIKVTPLRSWWVAYLTTVKGG